MGIRARQLTIVTDMPSRNPPVATVARSHGRQTVDWIIERTQQPHTVSHSFLPLGSGGYLRSVTREKAAVRVVLFPRVQIYGALIAFGGLDH